MRQGWSCLRDQFQAEAGHVTSRPPAPRGNVISVATSTSSRRPPAHAASPTPCQIPVPLFTTPQFCPRKQSDHFPFYFQIESLHPSNRNYVWRSKVCPHSSQPTRRPSQPRPESLHCQTQNRKEGQRPNTATSNYKQKARSPIQERRISS